MNDRSTGELRLMTCDGSLHFVSPAGLGARNVDNDARPPSVPTKPRCCRPLQSSGKRPASVIGRSQRRSTETRSLSNF
jgi:hypothetical protein